MSSMNLTDIRELYRNSGDYIDREVTVGGWVRSIRDSKAFGFIVLNDGTFLSRCRWCTMTRLRISRRCPD